MSNVASRTTRKARSARFLIGQPVVGRTQKPAPPMRLRLLPNIIRLAEVVSLFGLDEGFLLNTNKINSIKKVDELINKFLHEINDNYLPVETNHWLDDETLEHPALQGLIPVKPNDTTIGIIPTNTIGNRRYYPGNKAWVIITSIKPLTDGRTALFARPASKKERREMQA